MGFREVKRTLNKNKMEKMTSDIPMRSRIPETNDILFGSNRWYESTRDLDVVSMACRPSIDMRDWPWATHEMVQAWAKGNVDGIPLVLKQYMDRFRE